jgi:hypothetical protein
MPDNFVRKRRLLITASERPGDQVRVDLEDEQGFSAFWIVDEVVFADGRKRKRKRKPKSDEKGARA